MKTSALQFKHAAFKTRAFELKIKAIEEDGTFTGYGSVFGVEDAYGEVVAKGAFADSLKEIAGKGRPVPILWQHRSAEVIGIYQEIYEDDKGLFVKGKITSDVPEGVKALALMRMGAVSGLSIGYLVRESSFDEKTNIRTLTKLDLMEISVVTFPANEDARIDQVKSKISRGETITIREFESILREKGYSRSDAEDIAALGYKAWLRRESGAGAQANAAPNESVKLLSEAARALTTPLKIGDWQ